MDNFMTPNLPPSDNQAPPSNHKRSASVMAEKKIEVQCREFNSKNTPKKPRTSNVGVFSEPRMGVSDRVEICVGSKIEDPDPANNEIEVPVYASLNGAAIKFRWGKEEAKASKIRLEVAPKYIQVQFLPRYVRGDEKVTRKAIKDALEMKISGQEIIKKTFPQGLESNDAADFIEVQRPLVEGSPISHPAVSSVHRPSHTLGEQGHQDLNGRMERRNKLKATCFESITNVVHDAFTELDKDIKERDQVIQEQAKTIQQHLAAITQKEAEAKSQKNLIERQATTISQLQNQLKQLQQPWQLGQGDKRVIDGRLFHTLPVPNDGLFVTDNVDLTIGNFDYSETTVLSEFKFLNFGGILREPVVMEGLSFKRIEGGENHGKLVQDLGPHSIYQHEQRDYVRWVVRTAKIPRI